MSFLEIRGWRISEASPSGLHLWFDPDCERPILETVDPGGKNDQVDSIGSVSGSDEDEDTVDPSVDGQLDLLSGLHPAGDLPF